MNMIPRHSLETTRLDQRPKFRESTMNNSWIEGWISYFCQQLLGIHLFHRVTLGRSDEFVMLPLLNLEALFVVVVYDTVDPLLIYVFAPFSSQKLHDLLERNVSTGFKSEPLLHCPMSKHPR
jgi:hypothetical protein